MFKLSSFTGGRLTVYNNQPIETLMDLASKSIQAGEPVWFGCDVSKFFSRKVGLLTMDLYDYELVFGTKVNIGLNKAERLIYGDCAMKPYFQTFPTVIYLCFLVEAQKPWKLPQPCSVFSSRSPLLSLFISTLMARYQELQGRGIQRTEGKF